MLLLLWWLCKISKWPHVVVVVVAVVVGVNDRLVLEVRILSTEVVVVVVDAVVVVGIHFVNHIVYFVFLQ